LWKNDKTPLSEATDQVTVGALYFAMRSCEYSYTSQDIRTQLLALEDVKFFINGQEVRKNRQGAQKVKTVFPNQKNMDKMEPVIRSRADESSILCPVRSWGAIIDIIEGFKGTTGKTTVNTVEINGKLRKIDSSTIRNRIRKGVKASEKCQLKPKTDTINFILANCLVSEFEPLARMRQYDEFS